MTTVGSTHQCSCYLCSRHLGRVFVLGHLVYGCSLLPTSKSAMVCYRPLYWV